MTSIKNNAGQFKNRRRGRRNSRGLRGRYWWGLVGLLERGVGSLGKARTGQRGAARRGGVYRWGGEITTSPPEEVARVGRVFVGDRGMC